MKTLIVSSILTVLLVSFVVSVINPDHAPVTGAIWIAGCSVLVAYIHKSRDRH